MKTRASVGRVLIRLALLTVPLWLGPLGWRLTFQESAMLSGIGSSLINVDLLFVAVALVVPIVVFWQLPVYIQKHRARSLLIVGQTIVFLLSVIGGFKWGRVIWHDGIERVVARGEPLVAAIHDFEAKNGRPPESLNELVPQYIRTIPTTGIGEWPEFHYILDKRKQFVDNPWVLKVTPPSQVMGFDSLMYYPLQNYHPSMSRFGAWGYFHD